MYPNEPCNNCPEDENNDIAIPEPCGTECAFIYDANCVNYTGAAVTSGSTTVLSPNTSVNSSLASIVSLVNNGVSVSAQTIAIGAVNVNSVASTVAASGSAVLASSSTASASVYDLTLNIPSATTLTAGSVSSNSISTGSKTFTFPAAISGTYIWTTGTRLRFYHDATNFMEGVVTSHSAANVVATIDYIIGTGSHSSWSISVTGATGSQGIQGIQGNTGNTGNQGNQGNQGTAGTNGTNGTNGQGVPTGGTANQVLEKIDATDYNTQWVTQGYIPSAGTTGQVLTKTGSANFAAGWSSLYSIDEPVNGGTLIPHIHVLNETQLVTVINTFNASIAGKNGAIIHLAADITLTQDHSFDMSNIEIHGDGKNAITVDVLTSTSHTITCTAGSPVFKDVVFKATENALSTGGTHKEIFVLNNTTTSYVRVKFQDCVFYNIAQGPSASSRNILLTDAGPGSELLITGCGILTGLAPNSATPTVAIKLAIESAATYEGSVTIENMKFLRKTDKGEGVANASSTPTVAEAVSSIYFTFLGTWNTGASTILNIDMESYAYSTLNSKFGTSDATNVYIKNSMFMYGDDSNAAVSLKPNGFGKFGWNNPSGLYPLDDTTYA